MANIDNLDMLQRFRDDNGKLVDVGLGGYIQIYVTQDGDALCADCAESRLQQAIAQDYTFGDEPVNATSSAWFDDFVECANCNRILNEPEIEDTYFAALLSCDGDCVVDCRGCETVAECWDQINNLGSKWIFNPIPLVCREGNNGYHTRESIIVDVGENPMLKQFETEQLGNARDFVKANKTDVIEFLNR